MVPIRWVIGGLATCFQALAFEIFHKMTYTTWEISAVPLLTPKMSLSRVA
jgi:hypothetical protein